MVQDIQIDKAEKNDVADIARIAYQVAKMHDEAVPEYFKSVPEDGQLQNIKEMIKDDRIVIFKAMVDGVICGFLFLEMSHRISSGLTFSKLGAILNVGVDENYRNQGIGTTLLNFTERYVRELGGEALDLSVFAFNQKAIEFYKRLGYKIIDVSMRKVL